MRVVMMKNTAEEIFKKANTYPEGSPVRAALLTRVKSYNEGTLKKVDGVSYSVIEN